MFCSNHLCADIFPYYQVEEDVVEDVQLSQCAQNEDMKNLLSYYCNIFGLIIHVLGAVERLVSSKKNRKKP